MVKIVKSPHAESDLENIWLYSFEKWGEKQADHYYDALLNGINHLAENPLLGKSRDQIRQGYRSLQINRHVIYYRIQADIIDIVRVLHEQMIPEKHL